MIDKGSHPMRGKTLICDYDGTLMDTSDSIVAGMVHLFREIRPGMVVDEGRVRSTIGKSLSETFDILSGNSLAPSEKESATRIYRRNHAEFSLKFTKPFPAVRETLETLKANGTRLFVISNKGEKALHFDLDRFGLLGLFEKVLGDESATRKKPDPEVFDRQIRNEIGDHADLYMWGDTETDLRFARNIGAKAVFAAYGYGDVAACQAMPPNHSISTVDQILQIFVE